jgi:hypothetical protein
MNLTPQTKLTHALALHPDVLPYLISLHPHDLERLNSPLMRQVMPPRITIGRLAVMVGMPVDDLIRGIYRAAHRDPADDTPPIPAPDLPANPAEAPGWAANEPATIIDLLEADERLDTDPFVPLFPAIKHVNVGDVILLKHKWEPQPLYDVWQKLDIAHYAAQKSEDEWWIYLRKGRESFRKR